MSKDKITLIVTGGTLDTLGDGRLDLFDYARHRRWLSPRQLVDSVPELRTLADIYVVEMPRFGVSDFSFDDWISLHDAILHAVKDGATGIVVTQGSNYVEENAFFSSLVLNVDVPVVFTAAMRPASAMSSDGGMNLVDSVRVARCPDSSAHGVVVVMNGEIHAAREVVKGHTHALQAFASPHMGPLGAVMPDGKVVYYRQGLKLHTETTPFRLQSNASEGWPRVDIITSYYGGDGALVDAAVKAGAKGLVSAGFGAGRPGPGLNRAFEHAAQKGIVVVLAARGNGRVLASPADLERGFIAGLELTPWKARILLQLALMQTNDLSTIRGFFDR